MRLEIRDIAEDGGQSQVRLCTFILDASEELRVKDRPLVLICPGGGYVMTSDREADSVAVQFNAMGFHAAILRYSVAPAEYPKAVLEVANSIASIRKNARRWHVDPDKIILVGFSAGGHLACSYSCFYGEELFQKKTGLKKEELRPAGLILGYPVITSKEFAHRESIENLLGMQINDEALLEKMSLEDQIGEGFPRTFVWHTYEDNLVPVQNTLLLVNSLIRNHIPVEAHIFEKGGHGLSMADWYTVDKDGFGVEPSCQSWIELAKNWMRYYIPSYTE